MSSVPGPHYITVDILDKGQLGVCGSQWWEGQLVHLSHTHPADELGYQRHYSASRHCCGATDMPLTESEATFHHNGCQKADAFPDTDIAKQNRSIY